MRIAVIDLGSNTFHLLIVDRLAINQFDKIHRNRVYTSLGEGGIDVLKDSAIERGIETCLAFKKQMEEHNVEKAVITGTAALRTASNSSEFISKAEEIFGQSIMIIDGTREAELIFKGVKLLSPMNESTVVMDIGGGSTEFIIVQNGEIVYSKSFKLGVNVLHALFHHQEPINEEQVNELRSHLNNELNDFYHDVRKYEVTTIIGASGTFEVFESMTGRPSYSDQINSINLEEVRKVITKLKYADNLERAKMDGLPLQRVKLIVVGVLLVEHVLDNIHLQNFIVTPYALKEGVLSEI